MQYNDKFDTGAYRVKETTISDMRGVKPYTRVHGPYADLKAVRSLVKRLTDNRDRWNSQPGVHEFSIDIVVEHTAINWTEVSPDVLADVEPAFSMSKLVGSD